MFTIENYGALSKQIQTDELNIMFKIINNN